MRKRYGGWRGGALRFNEEMKAITRQRDHLKYGMGVDKKIFQDVFTAGGITKERE